MKQANVPTADGRAFTSFEQARTYVQARDVPVVVKASGLCAGKGVTVCSDGAEAVAALERMMRQRAFGDAGATVVVEERLVGQEVSVLALVDGRSITVLDPCQDHKQVGEGDTGPNTGGMGSYGPTPLATPAVVLRPPHTRADWPKLLAEHMDEAWAARWLAWTLPIEPVDSSSTEVRRRLAAGEPLGDRLLPAVEKYVRSAGLYAPAAG
jgi:hypothetical protein